MTFIRNSGVNFLHLNLALRERVKDFWRGVTDADIPPNDAEVESIGFVFRVEGKTYFTEDWLVIAWEATSMALQLPDLGLKSIHTLETLALLRGEMLVLNLAEHEAGLFISGVSYVLTHT